MSNERRNFPRVPLQGKVSLQIGGVSRIGELMDISPSGLQIVCRHELIEHLNQLKSEAGLYPNFQLKFALFPSSEETILSLCNVSYCRRLSQDKYHLGINFIVLAEPDEEKVSNFIHHRVAA